MTEIRISIGPSRPPHNPYWLRNILIAIGAGILLTCMCLCAFAVFRPSRTATPTAKPGAATIVVPIPSEFASTQSPPTDAEVPNASANIPGLSPVDVTRNLEDRQFDCGDFNKVNDYYNWTCTYTTDQFTAQVDFTGLTVDTVDWISATVAQLSEVSDEVAAPILGFVATMPYEGAEPETARAWVETTLPTLTGEVGEAATNTIGGVPYKLYGPPTARTLELGELP